jgi:hypothetical protein
LWRWGSQEVCDEPVDRGLVPAACRIPDRAGNPAFLAGEQPALGALYRAANYYKGKEAGEAARRAIAAINKK